MLKFLKQYFKYVVYVGLNNLDAKYDQIICDGYQASIASMEHLFQLGHTKIAYIGETQSEDRYSGYCAALASHMLPLQRESVVNVPMLLKAAIRELPDFSGHKKISLPSSVPMTLLP